MIQTRNTVTVNLKWELPSQGGYSNSSTNTVQLVSAKTLLFPIRNEPLLKDTRASIRMGLTHAIRDYQDRWILEHEDEEWDDIYNCPEPVLDSCDDMDIDIELNLSDQIDQTDKNQIIQIDQIDHQCEKLSRPILKKGRPINKLLLLVQRRLQRLVEDRYNFKITPAFKICIANTILQEFELNDLSAIYNKLFQAEGKLRIHQIVEQVFLEKYPLEQLDVFYDQVFQDLVQTEEINDLERPSFYTAYTNIWSLDRECYREYDYHCFVEYVLGQRAAQRYNMKGDDYVIHEFANNGVLMNVEKFFYYFSRHVQPWKVSPGRRRSSTISIAPSQLPASKELFSRIMESKSDRLKLMKVKEKEKKEVEEKKQDGRRQACGPLRFEENTFVVEFDANEPPSAVSLVEQR